jgi:hypothetical protein
MILHWLMDIKKLVLPGNFPLMSMGQVNPSSVDRKEGRSHTGMSRHFGSSGVHALPFKF